MALKQIRIGALEDVFQYDDGDYSKGVYIEGSIECDTAPVDSNDVVRQSDITSGSIPHAGSHEDGGADEIDVTGLSGLLADAQTPLAHTVASHSDTSATGAELNTLTDDSMADALHRHSELSSPDGSIDSAVSVDNSGNVTIGNGAADADYLVTFDGETNDGVFTWMEDEDYFKFDDSILFPDNEPLYFGTDADVSIYYDGTDAYLKTNGVAASDFLVDCGTDKTVKFQETVWDDINFGAAQLSRPSSSQPDIDSFVDETGTDTGIETYAFAVGEKIHAEFEIVHSYKEGTDLKPHVHFQIIDAPSGTDYVRFKMTYTVLKDGGTTLDATQSVEDEVAVDTQYGAYFLSLPDITGTDFNIGDQFLFTLERVASTGDAFAGDALIATVGVHYEIDTIGSRQVSIK